VTSKEIKPGQDTPERKEGFSRRTFMQGVGAGAGAAGLLASEAQAQVAGDSPVGPDPVEVAPRINGTEHKVSIEPRVTWLMADPQRVDLIVRYPAPFENRREVEQRILKRYVAFVKEQLSAKQDAAASAGTDPRA